MREKYIEEKFPLYFSLGNALVTDGNDSFNVFENGISRKDAEYLIKDREEAVRMIAELVIALSEVDNARLCKIWFGA